MDVKSVVLNGVISEEVYVMQPPGFEDLKHPDYVFKLKKSVNGLKQARMKESVIYCWKMILKEDKLTQHYSEGHLRMIS